MTTQQMKEIWEANPDEWICVYKLDGVRYSWTDMPTWTEIAKWYLISVKHRDVLYAWLEDSSVEIERLDIFGASNRLWVKTNAFIETYNPDLEYRLKETKMINTVEEYDNNVLGLSKEKEDAMQTISIKDSDDKEWKFKTHGYDIKFFTIMNDIVFGAIWLQGWYSCTWDLSGRNTDCTYDEFEYGDYSITPIKPEWYEDEANFPVVVWDDEIEWFDVVENRLELNTRHRLATKEEVMSLYVEDKQ